MSGDSPTISLIWAMAENRVIGRNHQLPWHLSADLQHFKRLTLGKPIVMGRKTWESLPGLLPKRQHIVVTGNRDYRAEGALVVHSIDEAVAAAGDAQEIMIVGGGAFYAQMLPQADRLYLTLVHMEVEGDAWFPEFDLSAWREVRREDFSADEKNRFAYSFITLEREKQL